MRAEELIPGFQPENDLERRVTEDPELLEGLAWGKPRKGHPEGSIGAHVADLLERLDGLAWGKPRKGHPEGSIGAHVSDLLERLDASGVDGEQRAQLRFITLVHDAFKNKVQEWRPRTGENHHAMRARRFAERYTDDEVLLTAIELHDRPYGIWRKLRRTGRLDRKRLDELMSRLDDPDMFVKFVELDGSTEGKNPEPIRWFKEQLRDWREAA